MPDKRFVFCIVTARCNIYLEAASHEQMLGWMCSIDEVKMVHIFPSQHIPISQESFIDEKRIAENGRARRFLKKATHFLDDSKREAKRRTYDASGGNK